MMIELKFEGININDFRSGMQKRNVKGTTETLANAHITIAGAGGLGSNIAIALARSGLGHLTLIDFDLIELSNLNRQQFKVSQLGMPKVVALKQNLLEFNPFIEVKTHQLKVTNDNITNLFKDCDIVCEAFDDPMAKAMLMNGITQSFPNKPIVMGNGMAGIHTANSIKTTNPFSNVFICGDNTASGQEGLMLPRVMICAGHQANAILRLLMHLPIIEP